MELAKGDMLQGEHMLGSVTDSSVSEKLETQRTDWKAVAMAGLVTFLAAVENTVLGMSEWPYMHTIDPDATSQFFGLVSSVSKCGHAIFAIVFAYWSYKAKSTNSF
ncbi:unnamed protein product [Cylicostephanus goldi]|uniref:Uncharacterized protein n=1 Tax=Cylicostephanus goldi TaxID=71465 RepID=A0A3P7R129_CYLGO|nr:unnamed protein product [Cylicostephanus goldi]